MDSTVQPKPSAYANAYRTLEVALYNFLQWYTSWFYWAAGVALGLITGYFYAVRTYIATIIYDLYHFFDRKPPAVVKEAMYAPPAPTVVDTATTRAAETARAVVPTRPAELPVPVTTTAQKTAAATREAVEKATEKAKAAYPRTPAQ